MMKENPFASLRVLELASVLAGPTVGMFFAELGAQVEKIEAPGGDVTRSWKVPEETLSENPSAYFCSVNWGKTFNTLDLQLPENRKQIYNQIPETDIVIVSYKPGDAERLGMSYEILSALNPALIYGEITGYGEGSIRVGYDAIIQAEAGFMEMNGSADGPPLKMPVAFMDLMAAHQLKEGLLAALYVREKTGRGDKVSVSLIQAGIASLANQATNYLMNDTVPNRIGSEHPSIVPYGTRFITQEGKSLVLAVGNDKQFQNLFSVLGLENWAFDERVRTNPDRVRNRKFVYDLLAPVFLSESLDIWLQRLNEKQVPAGGIANMKEVFNQPYAQSLLLIDKEKKGVRTRIFTAIEIPFLKLTSPE
jgi:crotonobetainyl-CoA:carnitine CoA-transferase CaiB-like acyl-CoA transferase